MVVGIRYDALDRLAIVEADADPESLHDRRVLMKVKCAVSQVSVEGHDEEDGFGIRCGDLLDVSGIGQGKADEVQRMLRIVAEQLLDCADFTG